MMPGIDGYEAVRQIKANAAGAQTPIVAISASVLEEERQLALTKGFDAFISKPVQIEELFEVIQRFVSVDYIFEDNNANCPVVGRLDKESMRSLPDGLICSMREALETGDMPRLRELTALCESGTANSLRLLIDNYDYDVLNILLAGENNHADNA
jgi:response regulator RpfG family c-di-GMP phosphodiesterase